MTERARRLRKEPTEAEKKLWRLLRRHQIEHLGFRRQHPVGNYVLDFYCPAMRLAVEVDGGQHGNAEECIGDERRTRWLTTKGIKLIRFWNNDVLDNIEGVWAVLVQEIERRRPRRPTPSLTLPLAGGGNAQEPPQRLRAGSG